MKGSAWCDSVRALPRLPDREDAVRAAVRASYHFAWSFVRVELDGYALDVALDYFAIGELDDFVRVPVSGPLALELAELLGGRLPTEREVVAIHRAADVKLAAAPWGSRPTPGLPSSSDPYGAAMLTVERFEAHNALIEVALAGRCGLVAGHKKDVLGVRKARVGDYLVNHHGAVVGETDVLAFCGWFSGAGDAEIQRDDGAHEPSYADYSHGFRLVRDVHDTTPPTTERSP